MIRIEKATEADKPQASKLKGDDLNTWFIKGRYTKET